MTRKPLVLIICTGNSCRSQMAEALLRKTAGHAIEVASAGSNPSGYVHPLAIQAMAEIGIEMKKARSKSLDEFLSREVETLITVCEDADRSCQTFAGHIQRYHWGFHDPALAEGDDQERLEVFRRVRDEIRQVFNAYGCGRLDGAQSASSKQASPDN